MTEAMIPETIISALVQAPFVLVMAYLAQRFMISMAQRDHDWQQAIGQVNQSHEHLIARIDHLAQAVDRLSDRVMLGQVGRSRSGGRRAHTRRP